MVALLAIGGQVEQKKGGGKKKSADPGPQPRVVTPGYAPSMRPSDAIALFDGNNVNSWTRKDGSPTGCTVDQGEMVCATGSGDAVSKQTFKDAQIHLEFKVPHMPDQSGQRRGNSGVYLQACYEVQILDSFENPTYADGMLGSVYGFSPPMVNAARKPNEWQSFDIVFRAPRCGADGAVTEPGRVTLMVNGVLVQEGVKIDKKGGGCRLESICGEGPLLLQDHSNFPNAPHTEMRFRNIWLRKLE
jgi:hypothetical protein